MGVIAPDSSRTGHWLERIVSSEAIILGGAPVMGYVLVVAYQAAYVTTFQIPGSFIAVDMTNVAAVVGVLFLSLSVVAAFAAPMYALVSDFAKPMARRWGTIILCVATSAVAVFTLKDFWTVWFPGLLSPLFILSLMLVRPMYRAWLLKHPDTSQPIHATPTPGSEALMRVALVSAVLMGAVIISFRLGQKYATSESVFYVTVTTPERVVLVMTDEYALAAPFDRYTRTVQPSFVVLRLGADSSLEFRQESVGPLRMASNRDQLSGCNPSLTPTPIP